MKKILSIDGGGIKGIFPSSFLASLDEHIDGSIWEYFDLIAGTSTGGIIALGLGLGFSPREILALYEDNAEKIFPSKGISRLCTKFKRLNGLLRQRYDTGPLADKLRATFQDKLLGHSKTRLMICATDLVSGNVNVFKTAHHARFANDYKLSAKEVALATSAAPIFFKPHAMPNGQHLVDGAMWGNNPMGFAAIEAVHVLGWPREEVAILSLGCTEEAPSFAKLGENAGLTDWGLGLVECFMAGQSSSSFGTSILVLGDYNLDRIKRINPVVPSEHFKLDGTKNLEKLKGFGYKEARDALPKIKKIFFESKAEEFIPIYS